MKRLLSAMGILAVIVGCAAIKPAVDPTLIGAELAVCTENNTDGCLYLKCCLGVCQKYGLKPQDACAMDACPALTPVSP